MLLSYFCRQTPVKLNHTISDRTRPWTMSWKFLIAPLTVSLSFKPFFTAGRSWEEKGTLSSTTGFQNASPCSGDTLRPKEVSNLLTQLSQLTYFCCIHRQISAENRQPFPSLVTVVDKYQFHRQPTSSFNDYRTMHVWRGVLWQHTV